MKRTSETKTFFPFFSSHPLSLSLRPFCDAACQPRTARPAVAAPKRAVAPKKGLEIPPRGLFPAERSHVCLFFPWSSACLACPASAALFSLSLVRAVRGAGLRRTRLPQGHAGCASATKLGGGGEKRRKGPRKHVVVDAAFVCISQLPLLPSLASPQDWCLGHKAGCQRPGQPEVTMRPPLPSQ